MRSAARRRRPFDAHVLPHRRRGTLWMNREANRCAVEDADLLKPAAQASSRGDGTANEEHTHPGPDGRREGIINDRRDRSRTRGTRVTEIRRKDVVLSKRRRRDESVWRRRGAVETIRRKFDRTVGQSVCGRNRASKDYEADEHHEDGKSPLSTRVHTTLPIGSADKSPSNERPETPSTDL